MKTKSSPYQSWLTEECEALKKELQVNSIEEGITKLKQENQNKNKNGSTISKAV